MLFINDEHGLLHLVASLFFKTIQSAIAFFLATAIYRVTLHPLAKYPGPFLAKITDLHAVYHAWKGDRHLHNHRCHERYGHVYRYGPNSLSFNTNTALQSIYGLKANCKKGNFYTVFPQKKDVYNVHSEIDPKRHAYKRRVVSYAFSDKALKAMEEYIINNIQKFCAHLSSSSPQDMAILCNYLTFDVLGDLGFGKSFGMLDRPENRFVPELIMNAGRQAVITGSMPLIKTLNLHAVFFRHLLTGKKRFNAYCNAQATERSKAVTDRKDFFYYLLKAKDPETGQGFSMDELWSESAILTVAGSDTTSSALAATFFYLSHDPVVLKRVTDEVRSTFDAAGVDAIRSGPLLNSCTYLRACIDEALRLFPPLPGVLPREVMPGGINIDGHDIAPGTTVGVAAYAIHHNEKYFPSPNAYKPERWLVPVDSKATKESVEVAQSAFCPFSLGTRGCIGKNMAYMELMTTMARAVFLFDMKLASTLGEGSPDLGQGRQRRNEFQAFDLFVTFKKGPLIEFQPRKV